VIVLTFAIAGIIAADQELDRRQTCLPTGSSAAAAGYEARSAEHPADGNTRRLLRARSARQWASSPAAMEQARRPQRNGGQVDPFVINCLMRIFDYLYFCSNFFYYCIFHFCKMWTREPNRITSRNTGPKNNHFRSSVNHKLCSCNRSFPRTSST